MTKLDKGGLIILTTLVIKIQESTQESLHDLGTQQTQFTTTVTDRLNELGRTIKEIKIVVERAPEVPQLQNAPGPSDAPEP